MSFHELLIPLEVDKAIAACIRMLEIGANRELEQAAFLWLNAPEHFRRDFTRQLERDRDAFRRDRESVLGMAFDMGQEARKLSDANGTARITVDQLKRATDTVGERACPQNDSKTVWCVFHRQTATTAG